MEVTGLESAEEASESTSDARETTDEQSANQEFIEEVNKSGNCILSVADQFAVGFVDVEFVAEELRDGVVGEPVFVRFEVEEEGKDEANPEG